MELYKQDNIFVATAKLEKYCKDNYGNEAWSVLSIERIHYLVEDYTTSKIIAKVSIFGWDLKENNYSKNTGLTILKYVISKDRDEFVWKEI